MTERPSAPGTERERPPVHEFDRSKATLRAISYGNDGELDVFTSEEGVKHKLLSVDPSEDAVDERGHKNAADVWFRRLTLYGENNGMGLQGAYDFVSATELSAMLGEQLRRLSGMEEEVLALRALENKLRTRREGVESDYVRRINDYLQKLDGFLPYWVSVSQTKMAGNEQFATGEVTEHALAQVMRVDFCEDGKLRTFLRQSDGDDGYVKGSVALYQ